MEHSKLFKYSKEEDRLNYYSHFLGAALSIIGMLYFLYINSYDNIWINISIVIYGFSMFCLFMASGMYHKEQEISKRSLFKKFDHAMILVMISGTYAPFCVIMNSAKSLFILVVVYLLSIIGIIIKVKFVHVHKLISITIYLLVGWLAVFMISDIRFFFDPIVFTYMILGGITYSVGALIYALSKFKYHHALWHVIVLLAAIFFYISIYYAIV